MFSFFNLRSIELFNGFTLLLLIIYTNDIQILYTYLPNEYYYKWIIKIHKILNVNV